MYAAVGALSPATEAAAAEALPRCYTPSFDACLTDPSAAGCSRYADVERAYAEDEAAAEALVDAMPYCRYDSRDIYMYAGIAGAIGILLGVVIA